MSCHISYGSIDGLKAIYLENDFLSIGVLADRGSDIFQFYYKPGDIDFLLRLPKGIRNPVTTFSQIRNTGSQFEDYYYGGWQICLPNSAPFNYRGAELGQHGEVSLIPWKVEILHFDVSKICLECTVEPLRIPIRIQRRMILECDKRYLTIEETVTNLGDTDIDLMWGQHIAFGGVFIEEGLKIETNSRYMETELEMGKAVKYLRYQKFNWPLALDKEGKWIDASILSPSGANGCSELSYLSGYEESAFYSVYNEKRNVGFALKWDGSLFKALWVWEERNATKDFPWWGMCDAVALEPWTSKWTGQPLEAIARNEWLKLLRGNSIKTHFKAYAYENVFKSN